ncbi:MAG: gluconokinase [Chloroflexi bacterium]|nr:gluconokinase [Chloroflexota bacterium]
MSISPSTVSALLKPEAYPHKPQKIELVQTQMSFIFLTGEYVYKIKKPVNLGYLDYTTLEKRRLFCHQELELNRRLCPDVYLAVVPIVEEKGGLRIEGQGKAIEYAVKMKQLPRERMMDVLLLRGQVTQEMVARVAEKLVGFHQKAETNEAIAAFGRLGVIRHNCDENFAQTEKYIGTSITAERYQHIRKCTDNFIDSHASLFDKRVREGRIRDCHGDLHAAHVCFIDDTRLPARRKTLAGEPSPGGQVCIYDCIEFNDRFRYCDVASEIAFLAMDLDHYQKAGLSRHLVNTYVKLSHDEELLKLLNFYKCYRAYVRGKVESFKLDDPYIPEEEKAKVLTAAQSYFQLAESYI